MYAREVYDLVPPDGDKSAAQSSLVEGAGTLGHFYLFFSLSQYTFWDPPPMGVLSWWYMGLKFCIIYFVFWYLFFSILLLGVMEPHGKFHVASCNGCLNQNNHVEKACSLIYLYPHRIMREEGTYQLFVCNIHDYMCSFGFHKILFHNFVVPYTACLLCI